MFCILSSVSIILFFCNVDVQSSHQVLEAIQMA